MKAGWYAGSLGLNTEWTTAGEKENTSQELGIKNSDGDLEWDQNTHSQSVCFTLPSL